MKQLNLFNDPEHELEAAYESVKESGMFWEFHPEMTGLWEEDRDDFITFVEKYWEG